MVRHVGVEIAAATVAALHFIEDQQRPVAVAQLAHALQEFRGGAGHAALALHRFQDHRAGAVGYGLGESRQFVERQVGDARRQWLEALGVLGLAADGDGEQGAAVKRLGEGDDLVLVRAEMVGGVFAGQLERGFVGLGAGIGEEHPFGEGQLAQPASQLQGRFVGQYVTDMPEFLGLFGQYLDQLGMGVAQAGDGDAASEVDVVSSLLIPQAGTFTAHRNDRRRGVVGHHDFIEPLAGDGGADHRANPESGLNMEADRDIAYWFMAVSGEVPLRFSIHNAAKRSGR